MPIYPSNSSKPVPLAPKDPDATTDYAIDWSKWLGADSISTSAWTVPAGVTSALESATSTVATIWLSGGTVGNTYEIKNRITTVSGRIEERSFTVVVSEK